MLHKSDLTVFSELHIVTIRGYEPNRVFAVDDDGQRHDVTENDPPGLANWFCDQFGMAYQIEEADDDSEGILWTDYDYYPDLYTFSVLVTGKGLGALRKWIEDQDGDSKYDIELVRKVKEETEYGDGNGVLVIMKHPEGFVIAE